MASDATTRRQMLTSGVSATTALLLSRFVIAALPGRLQLQGRAGRSI
jgi:hypothetical protein